MARPALTEEKRRETRRKIRQAASELHAEAGIGNISARAVAEKAGVSVGTLYSYFANLTELMQSLWRAPAARMVNGLAEVEEANDDPVQRLRGLLEAYVDFAFDQPAVFRGAFLFVRPQSQPAPEQADLAENRFFQLFQRAVSDGQATGVFRQGNPEHLAQTVLGAVHGSVGMPINMHRLALDDSRAPASRMIDVMMEWLGATQ